MNVAARRRNRAGPRLRIGLFGRLGSGNIGNDATLEAMLAYLNTVPGAVLDCMCSGPSEVTRRYGLPSSQLHWLHSTPRIHAKWLRISIAGPRIVLGTFVDAWRTASWVRRHDVVLVPGMGVFESTLPQRPWQLPYSLFVLSRFGRLFGTKVGFVCVGATVVREKLTGWLLADAGRLAHYRSFRDEYSLDAARTMGFAHDDDTVCPDLVFALSAPHSGAGSSPTVGVGVMGYFGASADRSRAHEIHAGYVETMKQFVRWLVETGHRVRLLIGDAADEPVVEAIVADAQTYWTRPGVPPVVYEPFSSVSELVRQVATLDTVVATRFHNVLTALKCAKPTVAIGYGGKHNALMAQMGVAEYIQDIRRLEPEYLKAMFTDLEENRERVARTLAARSRTNRSLVERQFAELTSALFTPSGRRVRSSVR